MAEEAIKFRISADGAEKTAAQFKLLSGGMQSANDNYKLLSSHAAKASSTLAAFGGAIGRLDPQLAALGASVGRASGSITAMTEVLGGPWGIAIGAAVTALGLFAEHMRNAKDETDALTKAVEENQAAIERMRARAESASKYRDAIIQAQNQIADASGLTNAGQLANMDAIIKQYEATGGIGDNVTGGGPSLAEFARRNQTIGQLARLDQLGRNKSGAMGMLEGQQKDLLAQKKEQNDAFLQADKEFFDRELQIARDNDAALAQIDEQRKKRYDELRNAGISAFTAVGSQGINALNALAKGEKVTVKSFLSGLGDAMVAEGNRWLFTGAARTFLGDPSGPALMGIGASEIAFGIGLGAATRGGANGGAGGGRSRSESPLVNSGGNSGGGNTTIIYKVNALTTSANPDLGREIGKHLEESHRVYGTRFAA